MENKIYEIQNLKFKFKKFSVSFYRDLKTLQYLWEKFLEKETEELQEAVSSQSRDLLKLIEGIELKDGKFSQNDLEILKRNINDGNEEKATEILTAVGKLELATQEAKEMFVIGFSEIKNDFGELKLDSNFHIMFSTLFREDIKKINLNPEDEDESFYLINFAKELLEDFFLYMKELKVRFPSLSKTLITTN